MYINSKIIILNNFRLCVMNEKLSASKGSKFGAQREAGNTERKRRNKLHKITSSKHVYPVAKIEVELVSAAQGELQTPATVAPGRLGFQGSPMFMPTLAQQEPRMTVMDFGNLAISGIQGIMDKAPLPKDPSVQVDIYIYIYKYIRI